jgi:hypothetical protein
MRDAVSRFLVVSQGILRAVRRVSTTLRQVLTKFSEFFKCLVFHKENFAPGSPRSDDRQRGRPTASPLFLLLKCISRFPWRSLPFHSAPPIGSGSGVATGLLIQTSLGRRTGGLGALRTKRSTAEVRLRHTDRLETDPSLQTLFDGAAGAGLRAPLSTDPTDSGA